jgi:hypothetical protein
VHWPHDLAAPPKPCSPAQVVKSKPSEFSEKLAALSSALDAATI